MTYIIITPAVIRVVCTLLDISPKNWYISLIFSCRRWS